ncbi:MAG: hypothetical protein LQ350_004282 [Teloschistes chrysophthalmus]|nr:MAG: hypothetical protein LQ350_004282 [Niorma chrysophthalma]
MDFIEGIGERYLIGKANAVPQQLEGLVKNKFKGENPAATAGSTAGQSATKDGEIEELRKQIAEIKAGQSGSQAHGPDKESKVHSAKKGSVPAKLQQQAASVSGESSRSRQAPSHHGHERHEHKKASKEPRRGRSDSIKTAVAAKAHSNSHQSHGRAHPSHSRTTAHSPKGSVRHNEKIYSANHEIAFTTPVYQEKTPQPPNNEIAVAAPMYQEKSPQPPSFVQKQLVQKQLARARSDPDICVVEVTEEEPRSQRRTHPGKVNFVEVLEKHSSRTRYVVR